MNNQRSANKTSVGQISICLGSGLQGDEFRAPGSTTKNIQGSRHRNDRAPGSTAKILGLQGSRDPPFGTLKIQITAADKLAPVFLITETKIGKHQEAP